MPQMREAPTSMNSRKSFQALYQGELQRLKPYAPTRSPSILHPEPLPEHCHRVGNEGSGESFSLSLEAGLAHMV